MTEPMLSGDVCLTIETEELGVIDMAARVIAPASPREHPVVLFCVPGMSYRKEYYDLPVAGYSFAESAVAAGQLVIAVDNVGTGASGRPADGDAVTLEAMAAANAVLLDAVVARLAEGSLLDGLAPCPAGPIVGVGHSMGGCLVLMQQADHLSFAAIAVLGFSNLPLVGIYEDHPREEELSDAERFAWATEHLPPKLWGSSWEDLPPYFTLPRENFHGLFYTLDVPAEVISIDAALATTIPRSAAIGTTIPRASASAAATIAVPTLIAYGDPDLSPDPAAEVATYPRAPEVTLLRVADSAHCHNLAPGRERFWRRLLHWTAGLR
jgi:alpha-beta hydrolase superfamily lysophospholipase